ncbi:hypothetical protein Sjap_021316 [Stephania japonica]|uniref:Uncharacterized protein n=1 Tax=Stephania japonica TaxID=461633 RepID=A0AAP0HRE5_9MAGN
MALEVAKFSSQLPPSKAMKVRWVGKNIGDRGGSDALRVLSDGVSVAWMRGVEFARRLDGVVAAWHLGLSGLHVCKWRYG